MDCCFDFFLGDGVFRDLPEKNLSISARELKNSLPSTVYRGGVAFGLVLVLSLRFFFFFLSFRRGEVGNGKVVGVSSIFNINKL